MWSEVVPLSPPSTPSTVSSSDSAVVRSITSAERYLPHTALAVRHPLRLPCAPDVQLQSHQRLRRLPPSPCDQRRRRARRQGWVVFASQFEDAVQGLGWEGVDLRHDGRSGKWRSVLCEDGSGGRDSGSSLGVGVSEDAGAV